MNEMQGTTGDDVLNGTTQDDLIAGDGGDDQITGGDGNDTLFGGKPANPINNDSTVSANAGVARVTFMGETAGYLNTVGVYKISEDGTIQGVEILFANASRAGSGGDLVAGESFVEFATEQDAQLGFFILSDGYRSSADLLDDPNATYVFRNEAGELANVNEEGPITLFHVDSETNEETAVTGRYGTETYHSVGSNGDDHNLNNDGLQHSVVQYDAVDETIQVSFEDLRGGGDRDYDDSIFEVELIDAPQAGDETPTGSTGSDNDFIDAGDGDDVVRGGAGEDVVTGGNGDDELYGDSGEDSVDGGKGDDTLSGGEGDDTLNGREGKDTLVGGKGDDTLDGGKGNDTLNGDTGNDVVDGGDGNDTVKGGDGDDIVKGGAGKDKLYGGKGDDQLHDGAGHDVVKGDSGNDTIFAGTGNDEYIGGSGNDTLNFSDFTGAVDVDLAGKSATGSAGNNTLNGIENVVGSQAGDQLAGDHRDNAIDGGAGNDVISGARGNDILTGGAGADTFVWHDGDYVSKGVAQVDRITDFSGVEDILDLSDLNADDVSLITRGEDSVLSVYFEDSGTWHEVAVLENATGFDASTLQDQGQLLI